MLFHDKRSIAMKTLIIAEAGVNHNGDLKIAKKLIAEAKKAGADIVKFQSFKANELVTKIAAKLTTKNNTLMNTRASSKCSRN